MRQVLQALKRTARKNSSAVHVLLAMVALAIVFTAGRGIHFHILYTLSNRTGRAGKKPLPYFPVILLLTWWAEKPVKPDGPTSPPLPETSVTFSQCKRLILENHRIPNLIRQPFIKTRNCSILQGLTQ